MTNLVLLKDCIEQALPQLLQLGVAADFIQQ